MPREGLKITITGPQGSGKSVAAGLIAEILTRHGFKVDGRDGEAVVAPIGFSNGEMKNLPAWIETAQLEGEVGHHG